MSEVQVETLAVHMPTDNTAVPLLARARYNNVAEVGDELSFRQGDVVTVLQKDFNGQVDWWLCEMRGKRGMVPANYFEIFHDMEATYDIPRSSRKSTPMRRSRSADLLELDSDNVIYDIPPSLTLERSQSQEWDREPKNIMVEDSNDNDYDLPPETLEDETEDMPDYDRPPSRPESERSSLKLGAPGILLHRLSQTSASSGGASSIYDVPPELYEVYDMPKSGQPAKGFEEDEKGLTLLAVDITQIADDEAEEMLGSYCQLIKITYENLFQSVYGSESYWGTDNKPRRSETLQRTIQATRQFDRALTALLEFGKGVANSLESSHDTNFKKKYAGHFRGLLHKRQDILSKLESLALQTETTTATVKALLENARTVPNSVTEFAVLVKANKALLFRSSSKPVDSLPVITRSELKVRPLPERPAISPLPNKRSSGDDYAFIPNEPPPRPPKPEQNENTATSPSGSSNSSLGSSSPTRQNSCLMAKSDLESSLDYSPAFRKRHPQDELPPLPYATVPRPPKKRTPLDNNLHCTPTHSRTDLHNGRLSPVSCSGDIITPHRNRSQVVNMGSNSGRGSNSPVRRTHHRNQSYDSNLSDTSSDLNEGSGMRRARSIDLLDGPYGRATTPSQPHRPSSPQPLRREERELLERFSKQMELINPSLRESVDVLLDCLSMNEPPKDFVTKSKLTVVAAYKLVYVADALCQKIIHNETKTAILASSNLLTENIKSLVSDTKSAALQYPCVLALERMGESLKKVFPSALDLVESVKSKATSV